MRHPPRSTLSDPLLPNRTCFRSRLVGRAKRAAGSRQVPGVAVYVETHRHHALSESAKDCVMQALRLAEQLGGDTAILHGNDITAEILAFARSRNVSQIVIGRTRRSRRSRLFRRTDRKSVV